MIDRLDDDEVSKLFNSISQICIVIAVGCSIILAIKHFFF